MLHFAPHKKRQIYGIVQKPEFLANRQFLCIECRRERLPKKLRPGLCRAARSFLQNHKNASNQPPLYYLQDVRVYYTVNLPLTYPRANLGKGGAQKPPSRCIPPG